ncbi:zinc finger protein, putative [Plasmodium knowlesi strain H]|uniref:Zinc finger protein, putative n=3 Tax=Plasmodium knowlesi TaxID=5850 RepID=A0A5K1V9Q2_PLAKH|nr:zinc finger protein, putative [Plasmodium knowlesi strain H]OTN64446.1 putative Zinc finger protein [Plasmodium knowlesi]CAA9988959.1 zinc finger protein, putative [Plasmodium knowlesi strain H]SBO24803.1 zinc finger protein, putative [Plasmodium knowlesi strain H]SBO28066.1 zinc finger protein, putative [Plasmodium knowlesi strain H]VVS78433.1 zinc finger protein, putative [Plasmodium knowlesi strain H]|eukprot:XP_002261307.1 zinc finger protein, putative [Plasmodium knowlesi strain H]
METTTNNQTSPLKEEADISPLDETIQVKSMCINCEQEGLNKIAKLHIPYFKNVLIHSFECGFCNYRNNVIQDLNTIKEKGVKIIFQISQREHMDRQLIKSEYGVLKIPQIDFEIPKDTQKGSINTIEGFLQTALSNLTEYLRNLKHMYCEANGLPEGAPIEGEQPQSGQGPNGEPGVEAHNVEGEIINKSERGENAHGEDARATDQMSQGDKSADSNLQGQQMTIENYIKLIESTVHKLSTYVVSKEPMFTIEIIDPSGLSSLEHYDEDLQKGTVTVEHYKRSKQELNEMGFYEEDFESKNEGANLETNGGKEKEDHVMEKVKKENFDFIKKYVHMNDARGNGVSSSVNSGTAVRYENISEDEEGKLIESFTSNCPCCNYMGSNNFCEINIPGFKKCLIMSYVCANCNFKTSEIKSSGEINPKGKKITLTVRSKSDLNRFVIKSDTASIHIPIVDLTSDYGTLGGTLTTIEGLILKIIESLEDKFKFLLGDSSTNTHGHNQGGEQTNDNVLPGSKINNDESVTNKIKTLIANLYKLCKTEELCPFDLVIDDIASNSYISSDDIMHDENLKEEEYERTFEQNDVLGLTSMNTENY